MPRQFGPIFAGHRRAWAFAVLLLAGGTSALGGRPAEDTRGVVNGPAGPLPNACVRRQATTVKATTDAAGRFTLAGQGGRLTAWAPGHFIGRPERRDGETRFQLRPLPTSDDPNYAWVDPRPDLKKSGQCANCHAEIYREHAASAHGRSATGRRFLDLYAGAAESKDAQHDWNLLRDNPLGASVCAACHAPALEPSQVGFDDLRQAASVPALGVHCDYCHKIADVSLERLGHEHGRFAHKLLRPKEGQLFFGPLDDVDRGDETFLPLYRESRYCASCHEGTVLGAKVYATYSEWLASPAKRLGQQCQDCHMKPTGTMTNFAPGHGGVERDPKTLASHRFPGGELKQLQSALRVTAERRGAELRCEVVAQNVGHRVPTGFIDRHLLLVVEAFDEQGQRVEMKAGPKLTGAAGDLAGAAGLFFGRLIADEAGNSPVPFWRFAKELGDTRLRPEKPVTQAWPLPPAARTVRVRLLYRRFFQAVSQAKGWGEGEVVVFVETIKVGR